MDFCLEFLAGLVLLSCLMPQVEKSEVEALPGTTLVSKVAWTLFASACIYLLSFGPISRLTVTVITSSGNGSAVVRQPRFPTWDCWTDVVYRPLLAAECGQAGHLPKQVVWWYVGLWIR